MTGKIMCNVAFAGGSCGMTMIRVGEKLKELCEAESMPLKIKYVDLWVSDYLMPDTDLVIEMFPYYKDLSIPVVNGRPFLTHIGEENTYQKIVETVREIVGQKGQ
jgi:hypothetical protein